MALELDRKAAFESISMGVAQIMGFNHEDVGYATAEVMFRSFVGSTASQVLAFFDFIESQNLVAPLQLGQAPV